MRAQTPLIFSWYPIWGYLMGCGGACSENECDAASAETGADEYIIMSNAQAMTLL